MSPEGTMNDCKGCVGFNILVIFKCLNGTRTNVPALISGAPLAIVRSPALCVGVFCIN